MIDRAGTAPVVLVVGYSAYDVIVATDGWPDADGKHAVDGIEHGGGGPGATAAVALARLGARVRLVTMLGDDHAADVQRAELAAAGVDCAHVRSAAGHRSAQAVIIVDRRAGTRAVFYARGDLPYLDPAAMDPGWLAGCDLLHCDGHEPAAALALATVARKRGLPVVMDAGTVREGSEALVAVCSDVIGSQRFAGELTGLDDPVAALRELRRRGPDRVATTCGAAGVLALAEEGDQVLHVPAYAVDVRDTTGAGDAFHAGYAWARARGEPWREALEIGAAVAALKCREHGGRRGLPDADEVAALRRAGVRRPERPPA